MLSKFNKTMKSRSGEAILGIILGLWISTMGFSIYKMVQDDYTPRADAKTFYKSPDWSLSGRDLNTADQND